MSDTNKANEFEITPPIGRNKLVVQIFTVYDYVSTKINCSRDSDERSQRRVVGTNYQIAEEYDKQN